MMMTKRIGMTVLLAAGLAGCVSVPSGPSMLVLPGSTKTFEQFRADDLDCRMYANQQVNGVTPDRAAVDSGVLSAAVGTVVGAAAGAALGGNRGAASGAGVGLLVGSMAGAESASVSSYGAQRRYDYGYQQCMYAKGHKVPVTSRGFSEARPAVQPLAPAPTYPPPPATAQPPASPIAYPPPNTPPPTPAQLR